MCCGRRSLVRVVNAGAGDAGDFASSRVSCESESENLTTDGWGEEDVQPILASKPRCTR